MENHHVVVCYKTDKGTKQQTVEMNKQAFTTTLHLATAQNNNFCATKMLESMGGHFPALAIIVVIGGASVHFQNNDVVLGWCEDVSSNHWLFYGTENSLASLQTSLKACNVNTSLLDINN